MGNLSDKAWEKRGAKYELVFNDECRVVVKSSDLIASS